MTSLPPQAQMLQAQEQAQAQAQPQPQPPAGSGAGAGAGLAGGAHGAGAQRALPRSDSELARMLQHEEQAMYVCVWFELSLKDALLLFRGAKIWNYPHVAICSGACLHVILLTCAQRCGFSLINLKYVYKRYNQQQQQQHPPREVVATRMQGGKKKKKDGSCTIC